MYVIQKIKVVHFESTQVVYSKACYYNGGLIAYMFY